MSVSLLIVSHDNVGESLLKTLKKTLGPLPLMTTTFSIESDEDPTSYREQLESILGHIDDGHGVLVLTDIFGATPCNIAKSLIIRPGIRLVCGMNLPMLIRVMNYPELNLELLAEKAISGGRDGVVGFSNMPWFTGVGLHTTSITDAMTQ